MRLCPPRIHREARGFWQHRQARANRPGQFARQQPSPAPYDLPRPGNGPNVALPSAYPTAKRGVFGNAGRRVQTTPANLRVNSLSPASCDLPRPGNGPNMALPSVRAPGRAAKDGRRVPHNPACGSSPVGRRACHRVPAACQGALAGRGLPSFIPWPFRRLLLAHAPLFVYNDYIHTCLYPGTPPPVRSPWRVSL